MFEWLKRLCGRAEEPPPPEPEEPEPKPTVDRVRPTTVVDMATLEPLSFSQGIDGPAELATCALALDYQVNTGGNVCSHCLAVASGKRTSVGMDNHGHGKGAA